MYKIKRRGLPASKWETCSRTQASSGKSSKLRKASRPKRTILGNFLSQNVDSEVPIVIRNRTGRATLRMKLGRAKQKRYFFELVWDEPENRQHNKAKCKIKSRSTPSAPPPAKTRSKKVGKSGGKAASTPKRKAKRRPAAGKQRSHGISTTKRRNGGPWPNGGPCFQRSTTEVHHL